MKPLLVVILTAAFLTVPAAAQAKIPIGSLNYLRSANCIGTDQEPEIVLDIRWRGPMSGRRVMYSAQDRYVVLTLPRTYINPSRRTFEGNGATVSSILAVQVDPETVRIRIFIAGGGRIDTDTVRTVASDEDLSLKFTVASDQRKPLAEEALVEPKEKAARSSIEAGERKESPVSPAQRAEQAADAQKQAADAQEEEAVEAQEQASDVQEQNPGIREPDPDMQDQAADVQGSIEDATASDKGGPLEPIPSIKGEIDKTIRAKLNGLFNDVEASTAAGEPEEADSPSFYFAGLKILASLCLVAGMLLLLGYLAKRYRLGNFRWKAGEDLIRVIGSKAVGYKRNVTLLDVAGEILVVSVSSNELRLLTKLEDPSAIARVRKELGEPDGFLRSFRERLESGGGRNEVEDQPPDFVSSISAIQEKLRKLKRL